MSYVIYRNIRCGSGTVELLALLLQCYLSSHLSNVQKGSQINAGPFFSSAAMSFLKLIIFFFFSLYITKVAPGAPLFE